MLNRERMTILVMSVVLCVQGWIIYRQKNPVEPPLPQLVAPYEYASDDPKEIYLEGMRLFSEQGHAEAKRYFKYIYNKTGDGLFFFALAWIDYRAEYFESAKTRAEYLIISQRDESTLKAYAYHLLGYLYYDEGDGEKALDSFQKAEALNIAFDRPKEIFRNRLGQALSLSYLEKFSEAKEILLKVVESTADMPKDTRPDLGMFYQVSAFVEWNLNDYQIAIELETACLNYYQLKNDSINEHGSRFRLSYYLLRSGALDLAEQVHNEAFASGSFEKDNQPLESMVVTYLLEKCRNGKSTIPFSTLSERIQEMGTPHQKKLFRDLDTWPCTTEIGIGN